MVKSVMNSRRPVTTGRSHQPRLSAQTLAVYVASATPQRTNTGCLRRISHASAHKHWLCTTPAAQDLGALDPERPGAEAVDDGVGHAVDEVRPQQEVVQQLPTSPAAAQRVSVQHLDDHQHQVGEKAEKVHQRDQEQHQGRATGARMHGVGAAEEPTNVRLGVLAGAASVATFLPRGVAGSVSVPWRLSGHWLDLFELRRFQLFRDVGVTSWRRWVLRNGYRLVSVSVGQVCVSCLFLDGFGSLVGGWCNVGRRFIHEGFQHPV